MVGHLFSPFLPGVISPSLIVAVQTIPIPAFLRSEERAKSGENIGDGIAGWGISFFFILFFGVSYLAQLLLFFFFFFIIVSSVDIYRYGIDKAA